ncbi:hypothetical protein [Achromobacter anxifer]
MSLFASVMAAVLASSTVGAQQGSGMERSEALLKAYYSALDQGFQAMGPGMQRAVATYCQDGLSIEGYCSWVVHGVIIGSHLSGNYEAVLRYSDRYATAMLAHLNANRLPAGACMPVNAAVVNPHTYRISASWDAFVQSLVYFAQTKLKRPAGGSYYQAFYCARRGPNNLFADFDPEHSSVPASEAEMRVARKFEAEILQPLRAAGEQLHAELLQTADQDRVAGRRHLLKRSVLYGNAYSACSRARFPANLCGYLSADRIEVDYYERQ